MHNKTYLSFDYGTKKIGIAIGQSITNTARPLTTLAATNSTTLWKNIVDLVKQWQPAGLVVGLSMQPDGSHSTTSQKALEFGEKLHKQTNTEVFYVDERLTTVAAREYAREAASQNRKKTNIDALAATLILESWLNNLHNS